ncbi:UMP kinase [Thermofilum sp.]|jgi:uridylate kinase|uniref:UMP kinase n=1 Tax=Thermofilum sp. TaxID=1961369 RepID=UPI00258397AD|nr:UMP kinase [Thermofilum sp.]
MESHMRPAVIKLGGSLLFTEGGELREEYVKSFLASLKKYSEASDRKIVVVVGGGKVARRYIEVGRRLAVNESLLDEIGIQVSRLNASLMHTAFYGTLPLVPDTLRRLHELVNLGMKVIFMGGLQPGQSTTTTAALAAESLGAELIIATDVDGIYTEDPKKHPEASFLEEISVGELKRKFVSEQRAGEYRLIDLYALNIIQRGRIATYVLNGNPPDRIFRVLSGEREKYTRITFG